MNSILSVSRRRRNIITEDPQPSIHRGTFSFLLLSSYIYSIPFEGPSVHVFPSIGVVNRIMSGLLVGESLRMKPLRRKSFYLRVFRISNFIRGVRVGMYLGVMCYASLLKGCTLEISCV